MAISESSLSKSLDESDLGSLCEHLFPIRKKYKYIGLQIGVKLSEIETTETKYADPGDRLLEVMSLRLKETRPLTWVDIIHTLRSQSVGEPHLADSIQSSYSEKSVPDSANVVAISDQELSSSSSEEDDSSPEGDIIKTLSEVEVKKLRKLFKCFFGKLCCAITDPVGIAAELQSNNLLSRSTMENIVKSFESEQVKTITLVRALHKQIKLHPGMILTFIQVLLKIDVNTGEEMWMKTGKICPNATVAILGSEAPPEKQPTTEPSGGSKDMVMPVPPTRPYRSSFLRVGKHLLMSEISPVLAKYKQYLRCCYKARHLAPADKYLPTLPSPYISLAMIEGGHLGRDDQFTMRTLHGGIDEILQRKTPSKIENLLKPKHIIVENVLCPSPSSRKLIVIPMRFILVEGPPGIGKSTFAWEVCRRWDEIEILQDFHAVVLLKLREKWVLNAVSLADLFRYPSDPEFSKSIAEELVQSQGHNLLLVLDGFDEVSHSFHERSIMKSILNKQILAECTIILTTRPSAMHTLRTVCQPRIDRHIEIIGFTEEERVKYVTEVFSEKPELQVNFLKYMFIVPHIKSLMYIPLNCAIITQVYYESQGSPNLAIPRTRTDLYKALTHSLLLRHVHSKEENFKCISMLPGALNEEWMAMFRKLAKFAFDSYHKGKLRKVAFFKEDIPPGLDHFGFMNECADMYASKGLEQTFTFLHLSLQEYLAAWHLANSFSIEFQVAYHRLAISAYEFQYQRDPSIYTININKEEEELILSLEQERSTLVEPAIFLAGITGWKCLPDNDINHWETYLSHGTSHVQQPSRVLLYSLYETQNPIILTQYFASGYDFLGGRVDIGSSSKTLFNQTPYDCYALSYCLAHCHNPFTLCLTIHGKDMSLLEIFLKGLQNHCRDKKPKITSLLIDAANSDQCLFWIMESGILKDLDAMEIISCAMESDFTCKFIQSLATLKSLKVDLSSSTAFKWLTALSSLCQLKLLHIYSRKDVDPPNNPHLWPKEHNLTELELDFGFCCGRLMFEKFILMQVYYAECDIHSCGHVFIESVLQSVLISNQMTKMKLTSISRDTMSGVNSILLHCPCLTTLELERTRLGYDGIIYLCSSLRKNTTLEKLVIDDRQLPNCNRYFVSFMSMETFSLPSNITCTDFVLELNNILKDNFTLKEMKIRSGLFLPLNGSGDDKFYPWTGLGPLQHFNMGAVSSGISTNLRRSFSASALTQPQTLLVWGKLFPEFSERCWERFWEENNGVTDFSKLFSNRKEKGTALFCLPSFTAPDTKVLPSFCGLDPRLRECLGICDPCQYIFTLRKTYWRMLKQLS